MISALATAPDVGTRIAQVVGIFVAFVLGLVLVLVAASRRGPARSVAGRMVVSAIGVVLVVGAGAALLRTTGVVGSDGDDVSVAAGDCIAYADAMTRTVSVDASPCGAPPAFFEVASVGDGEALCPDGERFRSRYTVLFQGDTSLCLLLAAREGDCVVDTTMAKGGVAPAACTDPGAARIASRFDGTADPAVCGPGTVAITYPAPARTFCAEQSA